jgi:hypothetical protein
VATSAEIIDRYARAKDYLPWIPYAPVGQAIIDEVNRMGPDGLYLSTACALVEKESGFKNAFGCDHGAKWTNTPPYCQVAVTESRVKALIRNFYEPPVGGANGVGLTQLTTISRVQEAERLGGAHVPRFQMRVGFRYLNSLIAQLGWPAGAAAYNAGAGNWRAVIDTYGADMKRLEREWAVRLSEAGPINTTEPFRWPAYAPGPAPKPNSPSYVERHPTRYFWTPGVAAFLRGLVRRFPNISVNTYHLHPPGWGQYERVSFDVWDRRGRGYPLDPEVGLRVWRYLWEYEGAPYWEWGIYRGKIWTRSTGWGPSPPGPADSDPGHWKHIHVSFQLNS